MDTQLPHRTQKGMDSIQIHNFASEYRTFGGVSVCVSVHLCLS